MALLPAAQQPPAGGDEGSARRSQRPQPHTVPGPSDWDVVSTLKKNGLGDLKNLQLGRFSCEVVENNKDIQIVQQHECTWTSDL